MRRSVPSSCADSSAENRSERRTNETQDAIETQIGGRARKKLAADHARSAGQEECAQASGLSFVKVERTVVCAQLTITPSLMPTAPA
jgi:hypothetical protein